MRKHLVCMVVMYKIDLPGDRCRMVKKKKVCYGLAREEMDQIGVILAEKANGDHIWVHHNSSGIDFPIP